MEAREISYTRSYRGIWVLRSKETQRYSAGMIVAVSPVNIIAREGNVSEHAGTVTQEKTVRYMDCMSIPTVWGQDEITIRAL